MAAIGLAITFGVMGVINMAHGEMIMLGAYTTWAIQVLLPGFSEYSLLLALPAAFAVAFCAGVLIEFLVIRHLYCLLYTSPSPRDKRQTRMPSSA